MTPAYDETYLPDAMVNLAGAFDYALNDCGLPASLFIDFFVTSDVAELFGRGVPKYVCGMSGEELVAEIMRQTGWTRIVDMPPATPRTGATLEYWAGWVLAYCQWARGVRFEDILEVLPFDDIVRLYPTLHEAGESRFVDVYDERAARNRIEGDFRLHTIRVRAGLSQSELARRSGVTLRSVQMYEQRHKDLGKAAVSSVLALARTLGCRIEDLLEP